MEELQNGVLVIDDIYTVELTIDTVAERDWKAEVFKKCVWL